jgi:hypothetical protein
MNTKLSLFRIRQKIYRFVEVGVYPFIALTFAFLLVWQVYVIIEARHQLQIEVDTRNALNEKLEKFRENAKISEQDRLVYGTIIKKQIPGSDNTFDTYALMESFYETTGIELKNSTSATTIGSRSTASTTTENSSGKYSASAVLTLQTLSEIIDTYQYQFSRFMTLNEIKVAKNKEGRDQFYDVDFTFQVYSLNGDKKGTSEEKGTPAQFTAEDKRNFDFYINNTNIDLYYATQNATPVDEEYEPSGTLF